MLEDCLSWFMKTSINLENTVPTVFHWSFFTLRWLMRINLSPQPKFEWENSYILIKMMGEKEPCRRHFFICQKMNSRNEKLRLNDPRKFWQFFLSKLGNRKFKNIPIAGPSSTIIPYVVWESNLKETDLNLDHFTTFNAENWPN